jgi:hypothetical protein
VRWWWLSGPIDEAAIQFQLDWVAANDFGGVEIAWLYPLDNDRLGAPWLSPEWAAPVRFAAEYAAQLGLGCDFTAGSAWPFGGLHVAAADASRVFTGLSPQRLEKSWETPLGVDGGYILNHLDRGAVGRYLRSFGAALGLPDLAAGHAMPGLFCDSWEVAPEGLWTDGFDVAFRDRFGYDIHPFLPELDAHPDVRYDYRKLLSAYALDEFYAPYRAICHELGAYARVQCHGAPADLLAAYALADVPETEAILFDPDFATFAASAAVLAGRPVVAAEAFTCLYGWEPCPGPGPYQKAERLADLKLVADALLANGVNQIVWHGMPYNPAGGDNRFYATTHVGPDSPWAARIPAFNRYLEQACAALRRGRPYTDVAVYLPLEDAWIANELPPELQKPSSKFVYELQEMKLPPALKGYHPLWISTPFLRDAHVVDGRLRCGEAEFSALVVDVAWLDAEALSECLRLARAGLPIYLPRRPRQPGHRLSASYERDLTQLLALPTVSADLQRVLSRPPLVMGSNLPDFWCRVEGERYTSFFAHPQAQELRYPLAYGHAFGAKTEVRPVKIQTPRRVHELELRFLPGQALLFTVTPDSVAFEDLEFDPGA